MKHCFTGQEHLSSQRGLGRSRLCNDYTVAVSGSDVAISESGMKLVVGPSTGPRSGLVQNFPATLRENSCE